MGPWDLRAMILMGPRALGMGPIDVDSLEIFLNALPGHW